eukprot:jgi/Mesvir1/9409/Mv01512-RA.1
MVDFIRNAFQDSYGREPEVIARAPGRLEILGNHTDYNAGYTLSVAIDRSTWVAVAKAKEGEPSVLRSLHEGMPEATFDAAGPGEAKKGDWANYIKGIVTELCRRSLPVPNLNVLVHSDVPVSAGMSSSAALEMAFCMALKGLGLPWAKDLDNVEWARIGQASENNYVGAKTGLLDQISSLCGAAGHLVFTDFRSLAIDHVPLPPGVGIVVANTKVKHQLTNEYNERREACESAAASMGVEALRDVTSLGQLDSHRAAMGDVAFRRAKHVVGENERVLSGVAILNELQALGAAGGSANGHGKSADAATGGGDGDNAATRGGNAGGKALEEHLKSFGALMSKSHESSRLNFENSCSELDQYVDLASGLDGCYGARLSGGGFGGITVHLVDDKVAEKYAKALAEGYHKLHPKMVPEVMVLHAGPGAAVAWTSETLGA